MDYRNQYRIVSDLSTWWLYDLQVKRWWLPFYYSILKSDYLDKLEAHARHHANDSIVKELGRLP